MDAEMHLIADVGHVSAPRRLIVHLVIAITLGVLIHDKSGHRDPPQRELSGVRRTEAHPRPAWLVGGMRSLSRTVVKFP